MTDPSRAPRILIVDDNTAIHDDFRKILGGAAAIDPELEELEASVLGAEAGGEQPGLCFELESAFSGEEAIDRVRRGAATGAPYALAFVDVRMPPGLDGIETLSRMWAIDAEIQAVVCTAYSEYSWLEMTAWLGAPPDRFVVLKKPFDPIEVLQLAHALTSKWELAASLQNHLESLEHKVRERTRELERANEDLQVEVAARKRAETELRELATHDALTHLPNRRLMQEQMAQALARADRAGARVGVLILDLDGFKPINDTLGHAAGDELLRRAAERLRAVVRDTDTIARMGGDEFIVLLEGLQGGGDAAGVADRIVASLAEPVVVAGERVRAPPSVGIAIWPDDGPSGESVVHCADLAMYEAKRAGGSRHHYFEARLREGAGAERRPRAGPDAAEEPGALALS